MNIKITHNIELLFTIEIGDNKLVLTKDEFNQLHNQVNLAGLKFKEDDV